MIDKKIFILFFVVIAILIKYYNSPNIKKENKYGVSKNIKEAYLAGGCFWGMEHYLRKLDGVIDTEVGYIGGEEKNNINYHFVKTGLTDFAEAVRVRYDNSKLDYKSLIRYFFRIHDPTTKNRQGNDIGKQYRSAVFTSDITEIKIIQELINKINDSGVFINKVSTTIEPANGFFTAEEIHQDYLEKNPDGYSCHLLKPDFPF